MPVADIASIEKEMHSSYLEFQKQNNYQFDWKRIREICDYIDHHIINPLEGLTALNSLSEAKMPNITQNSEHVHPPREHTRIHNHTRCEDTELGLSILCDISSQAAPMRRGRGRPVGSVNKKTSVREKYTNIHGLTPKRRGNLDVSAGLVSSSTPQTIVIKRANVAGH